MKNTNNRAFHHATIIFSKLLLSVVLVFYLAKWLVVLGFYHPRKILWALKVWFLFSRAENISKLWITKNLHFDEHNSSYRKHLIRYSRNTLGLVAIQPCNQMSGWNWPDRKTAIGIIFGISIPLYDDCFDEVERAEAIEFYSLFTKSLESGYWCPDQVPDGLIIMPEALRIVSKLLWQEIQETDKVHFSNSLREMNKAQFDSLEEHIHGTSPERLKQISARKAIASFNLLLSALGESKETKSHGLETAAIWAQWMDDYDDLESDLAQGTITLISLLDAKGDALIFLQKELGTVLKLLKEEFGSSADLFGCMLSLNFIIKVAHKQTQIIASLLGFPDVMPGFYWKGITS